MCYSTALDSTDMFISGKGKAPVFTNGVEAYSKEALDDKIRKLTTANVQLVIDKMETEKVKINLETNRIQLFGEKNSLVVKRKEFRTEIVILNVVNVSVRRH